MQIFIDKEVHYDILSVQLLLCLVLKWRGMRTFICTGGEKKKQYTISVQKKKV